MAGGVGIPRHFTCTHLPRLFNCDQLLSRSHWEKAALLFACCFKVTGSLHADTCAVYLIKRYFIVFFVAKNKAVWSDLDLEDRIEMSTNCIERAGRSNTDDRSEVIRRCIPKRGVKMAVIRTQESFFQGLLNLATKRLRPTLELPMACLPAVQSICWRSSHWRFLANSLLEPI